MVVVPPPIDSLSTCRGDWVLRAGLSSPTSRWQATMAHAMAACLEPWPAAMANAMTACRCMHMNMWLNGCATFSVLGNSMQQRPHGNMCRQRRWEHDAPELLRPRQNTSKVQLAWCSPLGHPDTWTPRLYLMSRNPEGGEAHNLPERKHFQTYFGHPGPSLQWGVFNTYSASMPRR